MMTTPRYSLSPEDLPAAMARAHVERAQEFRNIISWLRRGIFGAAKTKVDAIEPGSVVPA